MNETGHMLVARIAWNHMTPAARKAVQSLVADPNNPVSGKQTTAEDQDQFTAACWMDDERPDQSSLHFDNQPIGDPQYTKGQVDKTPNAVTYFNQQLKVLQDPKSSQDQMAEALRDLMHLTGDLHQPLHCIQRYTAETPSGDMGGNKFPIQWTSSKYGNDLHALWDDGGATNGKANWGFIKRPLADAGQQQLTNMASSIEKQFPSKHYTTGMLNDFNPQDWADAGKDMAVKDCYVGVEENTTPSDAYMQKVTKDMASQTALAGYRLANILNATFTDTSAATHQGHPPAHKQTTHHAR